VSVHCCAHEFPELTGSRYRRVLWAALAINGAMFLIEIIAGLMAASVSLQAEALDFLGDVANYGISLFVIGYALPYRATAAACTPPPRHRRLQRIASNSLTGSNQLPLGSAWKPNRSPCHTRVATNSYSRFPSRNLVWDYAMHKTQLKSRQTEQC
jgi:hypothetical protein